MPTHHEARAAVPPRYRIDGVLGEGGMGVVFDAFDHTRGHRVALKTLKQPSPEAIYRLKREFRVLADISHPSLVQLYDLVVASPGTAYTMEVVAGTDFVSYVRHDDAPPDARGPIDDTVSNETTMPADAVVADATSLRSRARFDEDRLRAVLPQLVSALRRLHDAGVVHRDVKPSNALVTREGRLVVLDFGLAANRLSLDPESMHGLVGTVAYMSPEQAAEAVELGPPTDWYAVGVMLYEALTGRLPHTGKFVDVLVAKRNQTPPRPSALVRDVPDDLDDLCMRLLAVQPAARPTGVEIAALLGVREARTVTAPDVTLAPRFTGREAELARLEGAVDTARTGRPALAWVRGPSGIGKSALCSELLARVQARHPDAVILRGRCYEQELVPFKAIDGMIDGLSRVWRRLPGAEASAILPRAASALQRLFPVLARVPVVADAPAMAESRDPVEMRARAFAALRELMQRLADRRPIVMFLDDLQWVDADTLRLLEDLLRPPDAPRLVLLVSSRSDVPNPALESAIAGMDVDVSRVDLGPLDAGEARGLVSGLLGEGAADLADRVVREAAGSPFFLGELVRYLQTVGDAGATVSIGDVVRRRISLLPASARHLLELIAIAGEPLRLRELAAAAGLEPAQVARDLRVLRIDHLVRSPGGHADDHVEPYHDRIRTAILDLVDADARPRHHRALAGALGDDGSPVRLARHWAGAHDPARAAGYARRAADAASSTLDFESACDLYRMTRELGQHEGAERRELLILHGNALSNSGRSTSAAETFLAAAEGADSMQRLELLRRAAEQLLNAGLIERGIDVLRAVLAEIGEDLPTSTGRAVSSFLWHHLRIRIGGMRWKPRDASQIPPRELLRLDCYITVGLSLGMVDPMLGAMYQAKGLVVALRLGEPTRLLRIMGLYTMFLMAQGGGSHRRGVAMLRQWQTLVDQHPTPYASALVTAIAGIGAYFAGEFASGVVSMTAAERAFVEDTAGAQAELNHDRLILCQALRHQGRFSELRERCEEMVRDAGHRGDQYLKTTVQRAFNTRFLADDDVAGARGALASTRWEPPERGIHLQHWYALRAACEIALYTGEVDRADLETRMAAVATSRLMRVQTVRAEACLMRLRLALASDGGAWSARKELAALRKERIPHVVAGAALGAAALATGEARRAHLEEAVALADRHEMRALAAAARWRLGQTIGGAAGAELVAAARTSLIELGVVAPERMIAVLAPGFGAQEPA